MSAKAKAKLTPEQRKATLTRVLHKIRPYSLFVVCSLIVAAVSVAAQLYIPILCGDAIDLMLGKGNVAFAGVGRIIVEVLVVAVVAAFAQWLLSVCNNRITFSVSRDLRNEALRKIQTLPLSYLDSHPSGDIVSRMVADVDTFADGLLMGFTQLFSGVLTILGTLLFMLSENVVITLVVVCITPLSLLVASFLAKRSYKYFQGQSSVRGEQTALVNEMIEGQKVIKVFNHEDAAKAGFAGLNEAYRDAATRAQAYAGAMMPAMGNLSHINYAITCCIGGLLAIRSGDLGGLSAFLQYTRQVSQPITQISQQVNTILSAVAGAERVFEIMEAEPEVDDGKVTLERVKENPDGTLTEANYDTGAWAWKKPDGSLVPLRGDVRFDHVVFGYDDRKIILHDISLFAKPGQKIAFVGSTGAGKTTITSLINRFYEIQSGTITYDGIDVRDIQKDSLRRSLGVVLQDTHLFTGTAADNIQVGNGPFPVTRRRFHLRPQQQDIRQADQDIVR